MSDENINLEMQALIQKYSNFTFVLSRIKGDEKNWINMLIVVFGGLFAFSFSLTTQNEDIVRIIGNMVFVRTFVVLVSLFVVYWLHEATNLRIQYYRTMLRLNLIELEITKLCNSIIPVKVEKEFRNWYSKTTRPLESRITTHLLPLLLSIGCCLFHIYLSEKILKISTYSVLISAMVIILINIIFFILYQIRDYESLKNIFNSYWEQRKRT